MKNIISEGAIDYALHIARVYIREICAEKVTKSIFRRAVDTVRINDKVVLDGMIDGSIELSENFSEHEFV